MNFFVSQFVVKLYPFVVLVYLCKQRAWQLDQAHVKQDNTHTYREGGGEQRKDTHTHTLYTHTLHTHS